MQYARRGACLLLLLCALPWARGINCPGLQGLVCGTACQQATCKALATFYEATTVEMEWADSGGWQALRGTSCAELVLGGSSAPAYCAWLGVSCCDAGGAAAGRCIAAHAIDDLTITVNRLNGSIAEPPFMDSLVQLHACGLRGVDLEGNELSGTVSARWGELTNLRRLSLSEGLLPPPDVTSICVRCYACVLQNWAACLPHSR